MTGIFTGQARRRTQRRRPTLPSEAKAKTERAVGLRLASLHGAFGNARLFGGFAAKYAFAYSPRGAPSGRRTHGDPKATPVFKTGPFDHSGTPPGCRDAAPPLEGGGKRTSAGADSLPTGKRCGWRVVGLTGGSVLAIMLGPTSGGPHGPDTMRGAGSAPVGP